MNDDTERRRRHTAAAPGRANSSYVHEGSAYVCENGVCRMRYASREEHCTIVASEPLNAGDDWRRVPENHLVLARPDRDVEMRAIFSSAMHGQQVPTRC